MYIKNLINECIQIYKQKKRVYFLRGDLKMLPWKANFE